MVNILLMTLVALTLLVWLVQELIGRRQQHWQIAQQLTQQLPQGTNIPAEVGAEPIWSSWSFKILVALWFAWIALVLRTKDGDFALVLVMLTLLSGVIGGLDRWWFERRRAAVGSQWPAKAEQFSAQRPIAEYSRSFFPVLATVLILRSFLVEPFQIPSSSMVPTLEVGDYILVNKFNYGLRLPVLKTKILSVAEPQRGDVVVFFPPGKGVYYIKRLIGLPGDHIQYRHKVLTINGERVDQTLLAELPPMQPTLELASEKLGNVEHLIHKQMGSYNQTADVVDTVVEPGHYFMMGDNRDNSSDSRFWGQVPEENIVGRAFAVWMHWESLSMPSFDRVGLIR